MRTVGFLILAGLTSVCFACRASEGGGQPTPTALLVPAASPSAPALAPSGDPAVTVENAVQACREKNIDLLRAFVDAAVADEDAAALFARGDDVRLTLRQPATIEGGRASVQVTLEIQRSGETETVERIWSLQRGADGVWRFASLPDCY